MSDSFIAIALARILSGLFSSAVSALTNIGVLIWDLGLTIYNVVTPNLPADDVVPMGSAGAHGSWPQYVAPTEGDSEDSIIQPDQGKPAIHLIRELLSCGSGPNGDLTPIDLSRFSGKRRAESKKSNPQFSLSTFHKLFGSSNSSTLLTIFGGRLKDITPFLLEERLPEGWQPRIVHPMGLTMTEFNKTAFQVELGIKEELPPNLGMSGSGVAVKEKVA
ncbi:hypothetical protein PHLCEN_2v8985 [Hermanssonia centrifuga]|uniref:Heme haloperoxidase family profile domain-containing protein n=1 Tax=Hermanssonia centrifuga TaxID=98765 RepID=A0A2R6NS66_9APHY|nr:hypothetical protein PHLCEN_2v8985 [Hermanssonia centrifuga]